VGSARPLRIVFDTNIVISALVFGRRLSWLRAAWSSRGLVPLVCRETAQELIVALSYPKFRLEQAQREAAMADYLPFSEVVVLPATLPALPVACRDPKDEKFLHLALAGQADLLVTGDDDLLALRGTIPVRIVSLSELRALAEASGLVPMST
jgi:putative PIN family toxin of toxin-antitoxin system